MRSFADAMDWTLDPAADGGRFSGSLGADWTQGRGAFGGVGVAGVVRAMSRTIAAAGEARRLRSVLVSFVGPILPDAPFRCEVETIRRGSSFTHLEGRVVQGEQVALVVQGGFGSGREGGVRVPAPPLPDIAAPGELPELPYVAGLAPEFTRHYEYRLERESVPFSRSRTGRMRTWLRLRDEGVAYDEAAVVALLDAPPPPIWPMLSRPARGASITWHATLLDLPEETVSGGEDAPWFCFESKVNAAAHGYVELSATLWDAGGRALMVGHQVFADFSDEGIAVER